MAETSKIYSALSAIMSECPAISKSQKNQQQGFMYRGVDVVMNVLQPLMIKHKVFAVPEVLDSQRQERVTAKGGTLNYTILRVKYTFYAEDGSSVSAVLLEKFGVLFAELVERSLVERVNVRAGQQRRGVLAAAFPGQFSHRGCFAVQERLELRTAHVFRIGFGSVVGGVVEYHSRFHPTKSDIPTLQSLHMCKSFIAAKGSPAGISLNDSNERYADAITAPFPFIMREV